MRSCAAICGVAVVPDRHRPRGWKAPRRIRRGRGLVIFLAVLALTAIQVREATAQSPERVSRVRVTLRPPAERQAGEAWQRSLIGEVVTATSDSLTISLDPPVGTMTLAPGDVRRIELSRGVPGRAASALQRGIGGAIWGAIVGSLYNLLLEDDDSVSVGESALQWAGAAGAWGLVTGAVAPQEGWRRVRWEELSAP